MPPGLLRSTLLVTLLAGACAVAWACNNAAFTDEACSKGTDCLAPFVCCTNPSIPPADKSIPYCEKIDSCRDYLPFLVEGNPCNRRRPVKDQEVGRDTLCADGLECCSNTLTCAKKGACSPTVPSDAGTPGDAGTPEADCSADSECSNGDICCEISFFARSGKCRTVSACR
jgi:hypothetical protein